ncbi:hypothetical protein [Microvirga pudoricolor]|uniref:hypothetical protein n=1 Tax=Microvirga pudoricolor TaxID=2778729 RepID=UPI00195124C0|nr:hypothetical protein [Microvirga pudoricolor]MBM6595987.1 hypothetical protein [Microvirga pudoricolor]
MSDIFHRVSARDIEVVVDCRVGHIRRLTAKVGGRPVEPLHTAPWVDDPAILADESITPNARHLSGDFFCAPFGRNDIDVQPTHGLPANAPWQVLDVVPDPRGGTLARYELRASVLGARLIKELRVLDGHPFLYERHIFEGGEGALPVANHAMTRISGSGRISASRKRFGVTPAVPMETDPSRGRSALAYPARFDDLSLVPRMHGGTADLTRYPFAERHEDFVILVEEPGNAVGWTCVARQPEGDVFLSLKNPSELPFTFFWISNGGRDFHPWNGRHVGVLGVEDARSYGGYGHRASVAPNEFSEAGFPTALHLDPNGRVGVRNVIGGVPLPPGWSRVADVQVEDDRIVLAGPAGETVSHPFDGTFLLQGSV